MIPTLNDEINVKVSYFAYIFFHFLVATYRNQVLTEVYILVIDFRKCSISLWFS